MKGLILSGGKGTRLRPLTYTRAKQLLPLANKPVLFYAIEALLAAGIRELGIVVGDTHEEIRAAVGNGSRWGPEVRIEFIQQEAPAGLAHAVLTAQPYLGADRFVMMLGDNLIGQSLTPLVQEFASASCRYACHILLKEVADPSQFGVAELMHNGEGHASAQGLLRDGMPVQVKRLIEKPAVPPSNLALVGIYLFDQSIFEAASVIRPSARGELEITDAIQWLVDHGFDVRAQLLSAYWIDTGKAEDILDANRQVLAGLALEVDSTATISSDSMLSGAVVVQAGAVIENSVIRGPAIIGQRTTIRNAYVGPFSSIYHDAVIESSELEYTIVLENAVVSNVHGRIEASLIGRYTEVRTSQLRPRGHKLMLGDHSRVDILSS
jgi:glucose-1-phosphate thymidylyltransferase